MWLYLTLFLLIFPRPLQKIPQKSKLRILGPVRILTVIHFRLLVGSTSKFLPDSNNSNNFECVIYVKGDTSMLVLYFNYVIIT